MVPLQAKSVWPFEANASSLFRGDRKIGHRLVQDYAFDRIKLSLPWRLLECSHRGLVTCISAHADSRWTEIDIFSVVLIFETRRQKAHDVHLRHAPIAGEYPQIRKAAHGHPAIASVARRRPRGDVCLSIDAVKMRRPALPRASYSGGCGTGERSASARSGSRLGS